MNINNYNFFESLSSNNSLIYQFKPSQKEPNDIPIPSLRDICLMYVEANWEKALNLRYKFLPIELRHAILKNSQHVYFKSNYDLTDVKLISPLTDSITELFFNITTLDLTENNMSLTSLIKIQHFEHLQTIRVKSIWYYFNIQKVLTSHLKNKNIDIEVTEDTKTGTNNLLILGFKAAQQIRNFNGFNTLDEAYKLAESRKFTAKQIEETIDYFKPSCFTWTWNGCWYELEKTSKIFKENDDLTLNIISFLEKLKDNSKC